MAVCVCPCVSVSTHRTSVAVHQYTYQHGGPWTQHAGPSRGLFGGRPCVSVSTHRTSVAVRVCLCVSVNTHRTSVAARQYTYQHAVHTGRPWVSTGTHRASVAVHQYTYKHAGPWTQHAGPSRRLFGTSVGVRQHTQDVRGCPSANTRLPWLSVCVRVCPSTHKGRPWLSISTHISTLALPVDCSGDFGPRGLSVQYTQDVRGCPPAYTGRPRLSVSTDRTSVVVRVCQCVYVCVRQHTQDVRGCPSVHISARWSLDLARWPFPWSGRVILAHVGFLFSTHRTSVGVRQHTQDVRECPSAHPGRLWLSVCVRVCPSAHTGRPWLYISTHISTVVLGLSTLALPVDCLGVFWPTWAVCSVHTGRLWVSVSTHRTFVCVHQHTQDVCGCPCVSVCVRRPCVSVSTHRTSVAVRVCLCVSVNTHRTSVAARQYTYQHAVHTGRPWVSTGTHRASVAVHQYTYKHAGPWTQHAGPSRRLFGTSVGVRQHTQDVRGCPSANTRLPWLSVCVRVCPSTHKGRPWLSISTHISTLALPVDCSGDFGPRGLSVQYTQDVRGCPPAYTGRPRLSVSTDRTSVVVRVCQCVYVCVRQHTQDVRGCPSVHISARWSLDLARWPSRGLVGTSVSVRQHTQDVRGFPCVSVCVRQHTQDFSIHKTSLCVRQHTQEVCGCPCVSVNTHITSVAVHQYTYQHAGPWPQHAGPSVHCLGDFDPRGLSVQYTQDIRGCPPAHTGRLWLSISTHISTLVLGLSTLALPVDCSGDFGQRGLSVQYTQDVRGCPPAYTGRPWLSISTDRTSVAVHQYTYQHAGRSRGLVGTSVAVRVCLCVSVNTHRTSVAARQYTYQHAVHTGRPWVSTGTHRASVAVHQYTYKHAGPWTQHAGPSRRLFGTSVGVRQHTQDVRGCPSANTRLPWLSVCVRVCPSTHKGRPWLSISTHISTLALPVDCSGDFGPRGLSVQYTQDVRGCPPAYTGRLRLSVSTDRTSVVVRVCQCVYVCVRQHTQDVRGCPSVHISARWSLDLARWPFPWTGRVILAHVGFLFSTHRTSVGVRQHTQDVRECPSAHTGRPWLSVCVRVCPSAHTGRPWLTDTHFSIHKTSLCVRQHTQEVCGCPCVSVNTHITSVAVHQYTYQHAGPWPQHAGPSVHCLGDFDPRGLSVQYTQDIHGCPPAHTGRLWLSISTHISTLVLGLSTLALPVDCSGDFGQRGLSVQYTQDVRGCPPAYTGRPWLSISTDRTSVAVHQYTYQHAGRSRGLDVRVCPSAHTGRPWLSVCVRLCPSAYTGRPTSVCVRQHTQEVRGCPCVSVNTHRTSVAVHQYTYQHAGPWTQHAGPSVHCLRDFDPRGLSVQYTQDIRGCPPAHTGRLWLSISTHISTLVLGLSTLALTVDFSDDFGARGLSIQYTQDVRGCSLAHKGRPWVSVSTHRTSVGVCQHTQDFCGCPCVFVCVGQHTQDVHGCPSVHISGRWPFPLTVRVILAHVGCLFSTHRTSVGVRQHTQDVRGCPSAQTGRLWLSISTHISTLGVGLSTLAVPVDWSGDFGPLGLSIQYTQDVRGSSSAHTGRPCVSVSTHRTSVAFCVCPCVSVSIHRTSYAGPWTQHAGPSVHCLGDFDPRGLSVQYTQDVRGCPPAHTGRLWLSISTHISTLVLGLSTLALPVDCSGDFGPRGLFVQYTQDVRGCPTHISTLALPVDCSGDFGPRGLSVQYTQDVRGCPPAYTGRPRLSVSTDRTTHISTLVLGLSTLALPVDWSGDFGPRGLSIQYTQDVRGCSSAHTGRPCVSVSTHRTSVAFRVCQCVSVSTNRTSYAGPWTQHAGPSVHCLGDFDPCGLSLQYTQDVRGCPPAHTGRLWLSISTHISTLVLGLSTLALPVDCSGDFGPRGLFVQYTQDVRGCPTHISTLALPVDCSGDFGPRGLSVQYTQDVRGCPPAYTGCPRLSVSTDRTSVADRVCQCVSLCVRQHTHDVRGCPSVHISARWSLDSARWPFPWTGRVILAHVGCLFSTHRTSVGVRQHTQDVRVCPSAHTGRPWLSVCVSVCPSAQTGRSTHRTAVCVRQHTQDVRGCPCVSVCVCHTHRMSVAVHQYTYQHAGPWTQHAGPWTQHAGPSVHCLGDFDPRGLSVQYTQDVSGCPPAHTGRLWLSISTHISTLVLGLSTLALPVDCSGDFGPRGLSIQYTQDVRGCPSAHTGRPWCVSVSTDMTSVAVHQYTYQHAGPWTQHAGLSVHCLGDFDPRGLSVQYTQDVRGCPPAHIGRLWQSIIHRGRRWVSVSTHRTSVGVCQHTQDFRSCPCVSVNTQRTSVAVHQYTYQHAGLPVDCSGDFGPRGLSVQYTQDVRGCPPAYTRRLWLSVNIERTSVAFRVCQCLSVCVRNHTQDVRGCPSVHISARWTSVAVRVCQCVSVNTHRTSVAVHQYTYQHAGPWIQHAGPSVYCLGDFDPRGLSVQYTQDVRGCPPAHTGRLWLTHRTSVGVRQHTQDVRGCPSAHTGRLWVSVSTHRTSVAVHVCPCVSVSTDMTSVAVHQYTYQQAGPCTQHAGPSVHCLGDYDPRGLSVQYTHDVRGCPPSHTGCLWLSISTHISTLALPVDCSGDFGPRGLSIQYTQDVRGCPSAHTGRPWVSISTHRMAMGVHQHTQDFLHISACWPFPLTVLVILAHVGCLFRTHKTSVGVREHTQDVRGCSSANTRRPCVSVSTHKTSVAFRVCPIVSVNTQRTSVAVHHTHRTSVVVRQQTQDVRGCPSAQTGRPWLIVCVSVCPCVSVSTHRTSVAVHQYTYQHAGPWTQHAGPSRGLFVSVNTHRTSVAVHQYTYQHAGPWTQHTSPSVHCLGDFDPRGLSVQYTQDVRGCPPAHTGRLWLSISTHISTLVLGLSTLALPVDCSGDFGPRGLSIQYTQDVSGCPTSVAVRVCPCVSFSTDMTSVAVHQYTYQHAGPWTQHASPSVHCLGDFDPHGLSVQYTQDVRGCPPAHIGRLWLSIIHTGRRWVSVSTHRTSVGVCQHTQDFRGCPCVSVNTQRTSVAVHQYTYQHAGLPVACSGDFGPRGLSVQYTQDVRGCPPAYTRRLWLSVNIERTSVAVRVCQCLSVCVRNHTQDVRGCPSVHISARWSLDLARWPFPWTGRVILAHVGCLFSTHRTSVGVRQHTQDVRVCPSAHTGRPWLSVCVRVCPTSVAVRVCPCVSVNTHRTSVAVHQYTYQQAGPWTKHAGPYVHCLGDYDPRGLSVQYTHDVRGCPPAHTECLWLSISTHISTLALPVDCWGDFGPRGLLFSTHRTSVGVRQHTQDVRGCPSAHTGRLWVSISTHRTSVAVRVCPCVSVNTQRTSVAVHQYTYQHAGPWTQHAGPSRALSVQYTQDVRGCPQAHTGRPWLSVSTHRTSVDVRVCPCVSVIVRQHTQDVRGCPSIYKSAHWSLDSARWHFLWTVRSILAHVGCLFSTKGRLWVSVSTHRMFVAVCVCPCVSVCVCVCPSAHTGRPWLSSVHMSARCTHRTSVGVRQHTQDVCVCPSAHTGRLWLSVCVHQHTQDVRGCPSVHISARWSLDSAH
ncbi:hypothetical protein YC2023_066135 [Brassica napus]